MHIYDARYPLAANARRKERDAPVSAYRELQRRLGLERVVVVQPTAYGRDNRCALAAMAELGAGARGVAVVDDVVTDAELERLTRAGMRGVRYRMLDMTSKAGPPLHADVGALAKALVRRAPERLVRASNWPHPLSRGGAMPDGAALPDLLLDWAPDGKTRDRILVGNPAELYGFPR